MKKIQEHVGGCSSCRARYAALYMAEVTLGSRELPRAAGLLLQDDDKERIVAAATASPPASVSSTETEPIRTGLWISVVLAALAIALLILLIQGPIPKRGQRLPNMQSKEALAIDLYCVSGKSERYLLTYEGVCSSPLEVEFRNQKADRLFLSIVQVVDDEGGRRILPIELNIKLDRTNGTVHTVNDASRGVNAHVKRHVFAFVSEKPTPPETAIQYVRDLLEGQSLSGGHVRAWSLEATGNRQ